MHTSFTGSARKTRQVNLSGRTATNPWSNLPGSNRPSQPTGTQTTLANAQADRLRRQHERDRDHAARRIQKTWRGHTVRKIQKQKWRQEWDSRERTRLNITGDVELYEPALKASSDLPYPSVNLCLEQLRLLIRFFNIKDNTDASRLTFFGRALFHTLNSTPDVNDKAMWISPLLKLASLVVRRIDYVSVRQPQPEVGDILELLELGIFVTRLIPDEIARDSVMHFKSLLRLLQSSDGHDSVHTTIMTYVTTILSGSTSSQSYAYASFAKVMLTSPELDNLKPLLDFFTGAEPQTRISNAVLSSLSDVKNKTHKRTSTANDQIWQLYYLLLIRSHSVDQSPSFAAWLQAISVLLSHCANELAVGMNGITDQSTTRNTLNQSDSLPDHVTKEIAKLADHDSIKRMLEQLRIMSGQHSDSVSIMAKPLANYSLALLRAFPHKATNIRMWLYRSSPSAGPNSLSTIQYLWQATRSTGVFQKILKDNRMVMSVLVEAAPEHNQIGRAPVTEEQTAAWQEEWRIILLFFELYTFILKIMDDEEFFALADTSGVVNKRKSMSQFSQGALPLSDIAHMTTFLKNLAFPLYWNAADLAETNEVEEMGGLSALFGTSTTEVARPIERKIQTLAGNGISQIYLKERVTGLLRMLHERDSRRNFLPPGHWLMTSHVDMQGFITSVVAEEERRNQFQDEDEDEEMQDEEMTENVEVEDSIDPAGNLSSMFGIRPPHMSRPQTSRLNDMLNKRREQAKKRRQAESLVPRLEILRNLPFFIPFDTRVQIFREFVYQDQLRRRNGWVDPDDWRVSVASSTQGRGLDGRPMGVERINRHHANIRRESVFEDAYDKFFELGEELKEPIQISFIDQFGSPEAGIDGGGVTKEFLMSVTGEAFDPHGSVPMFVENDQHYLYPNPKMLEWSYEGLRREGLKPDTKPFNANIRELVQRYEFLGRVVGKCMYEGILVDLSFAGFFLLKWALTGGTTSATKESAYHATINDLRDFDEELYQGLLKLKNYTGDVESDFSLNFEVTDEIELGNGRKYTWTRELEANGADIPVTKLNRLKYIDRITRYRLQQQPARVTNSFLKGLAQIIQPMWLAMFNQRELQKLVGGDNAELDINDLRRNTNYGGLYVIGDDGLEHPTVALFWKVLKDMNDTDRRKVLKFVTSTPRAPLLGFSHLNPKFSIRDSSEDQTRLPSTSTCVNLLKLPRYGDERTMREKLLYAVSSGAGFDLS